MNKLVILLVLSCLFTGCSSIGFRISGLNKEYVKAPIYPGVQIVFKKLSGGPGSSVHAHLPDFVGWLFYPFDIINLPLSFVVDTVCLPYDVITS
ncbi:YceK/YidQ family lipoprotein [Endozoicomonas sp. SM1973]|uniref:YceK/YidQ family lipoprotein n=1 Tax=Spartinivicinus marinus TaxID=2994442 RepID=A0A853I030_9GAMM|nr:YceK/YidQ family lipoprotein [Spartinivicinus marinus]MCX4026255.1 YceK/YidQ family lipoprotein [Spartinivicinus marinus]NYZ67330.1 YceK/YidQ family lipoprotein [Spartinivicinus marinus]